MRYRALRIWLLCSMLSASAFGGVSYAQDEQKNTKQLELQILSNPKDEKVTQSLQALCEMYFSQAEYTQLIDFLTKLGKKKVPVCVVPIGYYLGLCRYHQLKHLEETQNWKEYFDLGNMYREELFSETQKVSEACPLSSFGVRAQLINWLQHRAQNDTQSEGALRKLMDMVSAFAKAQPDIEVVKEVADALAANEEAALAKSTYALYVNCLLEAGKSPLKLESSAEEALKEGNFDLAEIIYERYIETIRGTLAKNTLAFELIAIIRNFATDGWTKGNDPRYAEKVFGILEESCGKEYFTQELQYLRAYNLQRFKEYARSAEEYTLCITNFPKSSYVDEAEFKLGILYVYLLGQKEKGISHWQNVIERNGSLSYVAESLYHKSLLGHYAQDTESAKEGYAKILALVSDSPDFKNLRERVMARQKEIDESKPIEYNLRVFLDASLQQPQSSHAGIELWVSLYKTLSFKQEEVKFSSQQFLIETGCLAPELTYLWSGDLGSISPIPTAQEFTTDYQTLGTRVVNLVVVSPSGVIGSTLEMVDVYKS